MGAFQKIYTKKIGLIFKFKFLVGKTGRQSSHLLVTPQMFAMAVVRPGPNLGTRNAIQMFSTGIRNPTA